MTMEMQERIDQYWSNRAEEFADARYADMQSRKKENWAKLISEHLPAALRDDAPETGTDKALYGKDGSPLRVLDLGTGAGFFAFILRELGCRVTAIDYSGEMIKNAEKNAGKLGFMDICFLQMDAQKLRFEDESFDFIFTRNVTWTLPDPAAAYREMVRVLKPGGVLMNADANYSAGFERMDAAGLTEKAAEHADPRYDHPAQSLEMLHERNDIARSLYIAKEQRPLWDLQLLMELGMERFFVDLDVNTNIFGMARPEGGQPAHSAEFVLTARKPPFGQ